MRAKLKVMIVKFGLCTRAACIAAFIVFSAISGARAQDGTAARECAAIGRELIGRNDLPAAERELRKAVELSPKDPECLALLCIALGMQHKLEESDARKAQRLLGEMLLEETLLRAHRTVSKLRHRRKEDAKRARMAARLLGAEIFNPCNE